MHRTRHVATPRRAPAPAARHAPIAPRSVYYTSEPLEPRTLLTVFPINAPDGNNVITLSSHSHLGIQFFVDYTINGGATQSIAVRPIDSIFLDTGTGTDQVNVVSTVVGTVIQGHSPGVDVLSLRGPNGVQAIGGNITLHNTTGLWEVLADDSANATSARTATLSVGSLAGLAPATINWDPNICHDVGITTGAVGGNSFTVASTNMTTNIEGHSLGPDDSFTIGNPTDGLGEIAGNVQINLATQATGLINLTLDDQTDPIYSGYVLSDGALSAGINAAASRVFWPGTALRSVTLKTQGPVNNHAPGPVHILSTNVPTTIVGDWPGLHVNLGGGPGELLDPQNITGNVYVTNPAGNTFFAIDPLAGPASGRTVMLHTISVPSDSAPYGAIDGLAPATIAYRYADIVPLNVSNPGIPEQVAAIGTITYLTAPQVTVRDAGTLQNISQPVLVTSDSVTIDDTADPNARNMVLSSTVANAVGIGGLFPGFISAGPQSGDSGTLVVNCGSGANLYTINALQTAFGPQPNYDITLNTGSGDDTVQVLAAEGFQNPFVINGQGGNDNFTVNYNEAITRTLTINGGTGSSSLTLIGPAGSQFPMEIGPDANSPLLHFTSIKNLFLATGVFFISGDLGGMNLSTSQFATVQFDRRDVHLGTLSIGNGTVVKFFTAGSNTPLSSTLFCNSLSIDPTGKLDLEYNAMQLSYSGVDPAATLNSYLASGYAGGAWNGNGIMSSFANATHGLGFADSAEGIVSGLPTNTIVVRFARYGDLNLDGTVGFSDLLTLAQHYSQTGRSWDQGDMNYDGTVAFSDLLTLAQNYGQSLASAAAATAPDFALRLSRKPSRRR